MSRGTPAVQARFHEYPVMLALRILLLLAMAWAAIALTMQILTARRGGRRDLSRPAGSPLSGILYNFTVAMHPRHKEAARLHPAEFGAGVVLHFGVFAALAEVITLLVSAKADWPWFALTRILAAIGLLSGVALLVRRLRSPLMRALRTPDDFVAITATCGLLLVAVLPGLAGGAVLLGGATFLFFYLPLGKLRHAVFFFVARADYGWRLGYRGVYPPPRPAHAQAGGP